MAHGKKWISVLESFDLMCSLCVWDPYCYLKKTKQNCSFLNCSLSIAEVNFLDRAVHINHEISTRRSKFTVYFEKHDMVIPKISFTILSGILRRDLDKNMTPKKHCLGTSCLRRLVTGDMVALTSRSIAPIRPQSKELGSHESTNASQFARRKKESTPTLLFKCICITSSNLKIRDLHTCTRAHKQTNPHPYIHMWD